MAAPAYGLDADLAAKAAAKYDPALEKEVTNWISAVIGKAQEGTVGEWLHDGKILCELANAIKPGSVKKINTMNAPFKQRENITYFQKFMRDNGMPESAMFGTDDLYDEKNMGSFITAMNTFGGVIQTTIPDFSGPKLGVAVDVSHSHDAKRAGGVATQCGGLAGTMQVQKLTQGKREVAGGTNEAVKSGTAVAADAAGLDADLAAKKAAKYDPQLEAEVVKWIEAVTGESKSGSAHEWLKNGQVLCRLANKVKAGSVASINTMSTPFKERENITFFQKAMRDAGVPESQLFGTDDLYEAKDLGTFMRSVVNYGGAIQATNPGLPKLGATVSHQMSDEKRQSGVCTDQYEAMQANMQVERPKNTGITAGADAGK